MIGELFLNCKFPQGIMYCDWEKLTHEEKASLWNNFVYNSGGVDNVRSMYMDDDHENN